jgi:triosephosphate isomerase
MKKIIIANWKANPIEKLTISDFFSTFGGEFLADIVFCPPFVYLNDFLDKGYKIGAQDCFWENQGAYTGQITPSMLKDCGCEYVIIGHSETREITNQTDDLLNAKIKKAQENGLKVIYCVGEKQGQDYQTVIKEQLGDGLRNVDLTNLIIAYEPVWAIGTDKPCDPETVAKVKQFIVEFLNNKDIPFLYGGSVNSENAKEFLQITDGLLVGSASLDAKSFMEICNQAS